MTSINTSILPVIKTEWQSQLNALRSANENAKNTVTNFQRQMDGNTALESTLKPQLEQAQLSQWEAAQKYNSFIESGNQILKVASDAEARLKSKSLSLWERSGLENTRDNMINLASEFNTFKTQNGASLQNLNKMDIGPKTYFSDGRVEWNTNKVGGLAGQIWDNTKTLAGDVKAALLKGPFTTEQNYAMCETALGKVLENLAGKVLKPIPGTPDMLWDKTLEEAVGASDPAGVMCRLVYPKGMSPKPEWGRTATVC